MTRLREASIVLSGLFALCAGAAVRATSVGDSTVAEILVLLAAAALGALLGLRDRFGE